MRPVRQTLSFLYDANGIAEAQAAAGAADADLDGVLVSGGVATFTTAQYITINSGSNIAAITFTVYGTDNSGNSITATVTGINNSTVATTSVFLTVTRVAVSGTTGGSTFIVGTLGAGAGRVVGMDTNLNPFQVGFGINRFSGTAATATVQYTFDDIQSASFRESTAVWYDHPDVASETASASGNFDKPVSAVRAVMVSASAASGITFEVIQSGTKS